VYKPQSCRKGEKEKEKSINYTAKIYINYKTPLSFLIYLLYFKTHNN